MQDRFTHQSTGLAVDPITLEVIRHALVAIANQIDANIKRTAFSPYIYEYNDFAVGLPAPDGQLFAQCTGGMPPFVADSVGMAVRDGLEIYGRERLCGGDVVVCNHAAVQGQHLNNTVLAASTAGAETVEEFYRGKTITMVVGTGVGGGAVSAYPMALGPVIKKYIPGHPNLVVSYMPAPAASRRRAISTVSPHRMGPPGASSPAAFCWHRCSGLRRRNSIPPDSTGSVAPPARSPWGWCGTLRPRCARSR